MKKWLKSLSIVVLLMSSVGIISACSNDKENEEKMDKENMDGMDHGNMDKE
ncbi:MAG: Vmc-like lipoprotein signal peptide domain-containing protein [Bacillota bacterium]|jgi:uncharacterized lipoprotein|uniref:Vmc-like lipoprotein signal peptide domain-containing protein n=1 Tax=Fictibacillus TaxID=1329200 RepID=UPI0018CEB6B1|nr:MULTISPECIES: hypothetical protein [unclassified Fictibacillus]MBH0157185.1 hypothetical protein [Fictibacillus sp. 5RED26]MBH0159506.1 hypothetical protein [Fictibacillus sp. 26RED30]MBH0163694.1 hypothetical protein [Fictibacillus sp. 7GRE50]MBH0169679.1 hypothetical protein [Fictibacillus sp. 18YEL24]MBH0174179.1 hypothetical protein [Fictibacillus sp. 23RED33]